MQVRENLLLQKTQILLCVSFTSAREQKATKEMSLGPLFVDVNPLGNCRKENNERNVVTFRANANLARQLWGEPSRIALRTLRDLTVRYSLSVAAGDLQFLDGRWYVTHSGLLQLASRKGCRGITTILQERISDVAAG